MTDPISNERLAEMLAGLEGVTPGPWKKQALGGSSTVIASTMPPRNDRRTAYSYACRGDEFCLAAVFLEDDGQPRLDFVTFGHDDAAHIARCDPDTIRSLIEEVQACRQSPAGVEPVAWRIGHQFDGENIVWTYFDGADEANEAKAQPLYASPPPKAVTITDEMVERAITAFQSKDEQIERLTRERDEALAAEDEAKDSFWAIYPDWVKMKGHGISTEAARTMLVERADDLEQQVQKLTADNERVREALGAADYLIDRLRNAWFGNSVRDMDEAEVAYTTARSALETQEDRE